CSRMHDIEPMYTARLRLVPATLAHLDAELESHAALGRLFRAPVPLSWPPGEYDRAAAEFFREPLRAHPDAIGWFGWYAMRHATASAPALQVGAVVTSVRPIREVASRSAIPSCRIPSLGPRGRIAARARGAHCRPRTWRASSRAPRRDEMLTYR
ncbi:hypothetical protein B1B_18951, partial [mine drainage metagenome]